MKNAPAAALPLSRQRGWSIAELMIVMAVVAIIAAIAYPSYQSSLRKGRRVEAMTALSNIQQAQERHRSARPAYTDLLTAAPTASIPGLGQPGPRTNNGYYDLSITVDGGTAATIYIATATAVAGTSQAGDAPCTVLAVRMAGGNVRYGAGAVIDWSAANTDPQRCWAR
ncbi:MAG: type IV pilin protein [Rubrivivax sp.]|nr:type IV pilin protein [Rubrivivax sp.]